MRSHVIPFLFAGVMACQPLAAQISVSLTALTPITTTATEGLITNTFTRPAGPLPTAYLEQDSTIPGTGTSASFASDAEVRNDEASCYVGVACSNNTAAAVTSINTIELLVNFTAAVPTPVRMSLEFTSLLPPGAVVPQALIDVDNDGSIDYANGNQLSWIPPRTIGPAGWQFRIIVDANLAQLGWLGNDLRIVLKPDNDVLVVPAVVGCISQGPNVAPSFLDRGITVREVTGGVIPRVFVFGLQAQPVLLPSATSFPCLLLTRPDVVLLAPSFASFAIALPASVRPATIWIQGVELHAGAVLTNSGVRVTAN